jgi:DNA-binding CsgD family transcriptional regulator
LTADVARLLTQYFPTARREIAAGGLPEPMRGWIHVSLRTLERSPPSHPLFCLTTEGPGGRLFARLFPGYAGTPTVVRLTEAMHQPSVLTLQSRGLTERQCQVLHWLMAGKRNSEIGAILGASERTISTHVETLLRRTGAETRHGAAHVARQWLSQLADA